MRPGGCYGEKDDGDDYKNEKTVTSALPRRASCPRLQLVVPDHQLVQHGTILDYVSRGRMNFF